MSNEDHLLTEDTVKLWKLNIEHSPVPPQSLQSFTGNLLKGIRKPERRKAKIQTCMQEIMGEVQKYNEEIRENEDREFAILRLEPDLRKVFQTIDVGKSPPKAKFIPVSEPDYIPGVGPVGSRIESWVLPTEAFTPNEQVSITKIREFRDARCKLHVDRNVRVQILKALCVKAIDEGVSLPKEVKEFVEKETLGKKPEAVFKVHNPDYTSFTFHGKSYMVTPRQGAAIRILHEAYVKNPSHPCVSGKTITKQLGEETSELRNTFRHTKSKKLWDTLIIQGEKKGFYRLNI